MEKSHISRQDRILTIVQEHTEATLQKADPNQEWIHAGVIADVLGMDRTNVARELNALYKSGLLIKVHGRPTLYISRSVVTRHYPKSFFPSDLPKGSSLTNPSSESPSTHANGSGRGAAGMDAQMGFHRTLHSAEQKAIAAVMYPTGDLHMLVTGSVGVGKARFAKNVYTYAVSNGILPEKAPFVMANCEQSSLFPELLFGQIFGYGHDAAGRGEKSRRGLIERASGGILCLSGIEDLPPQVLNALIVLLRENMYARAGEASVSRRSTAMVMGISTKSADSPSMSVLQQYFPIHIHIPDLVQWSVSELTELLIRAFQREAVTTGLTFQVRRNILSALLKSSFPGNLNGLNRSVREICALAFAEYHASHRHSKVIEIGTRYLQPEFLESVHTNPQRDRKIQTMLDEMNLEYLIISPYTFTSNQNSSAQLLEFLAKNREQTTEEIVFDSDLQSTLTPILSATEKYFLQCALLSSQREHWDSAPVSDYLARARQVFRPYPQFLSLFDNPKHLCIFSACLSNLLHGRLPPIKNSNELWALLKKQLPEESTASAELLREDFCELERIYLATCLYRLQKSLFRYIPILAAFHGDGVAEGMAEYVNTALNCELVHGISLNQQMDFSSYLETILEEAGRIDCGAGILVAADMEPLTTLHESIYSRAGIYSETVSNVNLPTLLAIGECALQVGMTLHTLAKRFRSSGPESPHPSPSFIDRLTNEMLAPSLTFLNPQKTVDLLRPTLEKVLDELEIAQENEIVVKFIFHCAHMLERLVCGKALKYDGLKNFIARNANIMQVLEKHMRYPAEMFGVAIPTSEIAYIAEILLPYHH